MSLHPATQIVTWCVLVVIMQRLPINALLIVSAFISLAACVLSKNQFFQLLSRTRWVMVSLLLIYAYSIPGQPIWATLGIFSPSCEGLLDGLLQLARLLSSLAGLAYLLHCLGRTQLIAGLYTLCTPLRWLGLSRERLSVRLALTLHYAEMAMLNRSNNWKDHLNSMFEFHHEPSGQLELPAYQFSMCDVLLITGLVSMVWWALR